MYALPKHSTHSYHSILSFGPQTYHVGNCINTLTLTITSLHQIKNSSVDVLTYMIWDLQHVIKQTSKKQLNYCTNFKGQNIYRWLPFDECPPYLARCLVMQSHRKMHLCPSPLLLLSQHPSKGNQQLLSTQVTHKQTINKCKSHTKTIHTNALRHKILTKYALNHDLPPLPSLWVPWVFSYTHCASCCWVHLFLFFSNHDFPSSQNAFVHQDGFL